MAIKKNNNEFDNSLSFFIKSIEKTKHLSSKIQKELVTLAQKGDLEARNQLVETNQKFIIKTARNYKNRGVELHDLVVEGTLGLIEAIERFNPEYNVNFLTYASHWIKKYILCAIQNNGNNYEYNENECNIELNDNDDLYECREIEICGLTNEIENLILDESFENLEKKETQELWNQIKESRFQNGKIPPLDVLRVFHISFSLFLCIGVFWKLRPKRME
jgi:RNA polymerase sigma factor (sigma-70 family)